jgi:hypothetical protein
MGVNQMKWFVYVDAEYYAYTHVTEADTAEEAARIAIDLQHGRTYPRYPDEATLPRLRPAVPACAVVPFADVTFIGTETRIRGLIADWPS